MTPVTLTRARYATLDDGALWLLQDSDGRPYLVDTALGSLLTLPAVEPLTPVLAYENFMTEWPCAERFSLGQPVATVAVGKPATFAVRDRHGRAEAIETAPLRTIATAAFDVPDSVVVNTAPDLISAVASRKQALVVVETLLGERVLLDLCDSGAFCVVSYYRAADTSGVVVHPPRPSYVWSNPKVGCRFRWETENPSGRARQHRTLGEVVAVRVVEGV